MELGWMLRSPAEPSVAHSCTQGKGGHLSLQELAALPQGCDLWCHNLSVPAGEVKDCVPGRQARGLGGTDTQSLAWGVNKHAYMDSCVHAVCVPEPVTRHLPSSTPTSWLTHPYLSSTPGAQGCVCSSTLCALQVLLPCPLLEEATGPAQLFVPHLRPTRQRFICGTHYPLTN